MDLLTSKKEKIKLMETPLGRGGEGNVYEVISPSHYQGFVAKIYHPTERTSTREAKIQYLIKNRPAVKDQQVVIWAEETLYQQGKFVGFLMLKAKSAHDLTALCSLHVPSKLGDNWRIKFSRTTQYGLHNRLKVCFNIAKAIEQIHQTQKYVLVDSKPENIKVALDGRVSMIDLDSVEIIEQNKVLFAAEKASPEYSPAELKSYNIKNDLIHQTWDRFSMGVVFYKILFGLHPYTGSCKKPYDKSDTNEAKIQKGLFPHGPRAKYFQVIPEPHLGFHAISSEVQELFKRCFNEGHLNPEARPTASEWVEVFKRVDIFEPIHYMIKQEELNLNPRPAQPRYQPVLHAVTVGAAMVLLATFSTFYLSSYKMPLIQAPNAATTTISTFENMPKVLNKRQMEEKYGYVDNFKEGRGRTKNKEKYGFLNKDGEVVVDFKYDKASNFQEGKARVAINERYGFINQSGQSVTPLKYDWVGQFSGGLAKVRINGKTGFINSKNQLVIPIQYEQASSFQEGFSRVKKDGKWGFINTQGQALIAPQYERVHNFHENLAAVQLDYKWGFINNYGQVIIPIEYDWVTSFVDGFAMVRDEKGFFYIDTNGKRISPETYQKLSQGKDQKFLITGY